MRERGEKERYRGEIGREIEGREREIEEREIEVERERERDKKK